MARTLLVWGLDKKDVCREEDVMTEHGDCECSWLLERRQ
jgi:hypothetical protein